MPQTSQGSRHQPHAERLRKLWRSRGTLVSSSYRQYGNRVLTEDSLQPEEEEKLDPHARCQFTNRKTRLSVPHLTFALFTGQFCRVNKDGLGNYCRTMAFGGRHLCTTGTLVSGIRTHSDHTETIGSACPNSTSTKVTKISMFELTAN